MELLHSTFGGTVGGSPPMNRVDRCLRRNEVEITGQGPRFSQALEKKGHRRPLLQVSARANRSASAWLRFASHQLSP